MPMNRETTMSLFTELRHQDSPAELISSIETHARQGFVPARAEASSGPALLSLFSGPGGLDQGFKDEGFSAQVAIDNDLECVKSFAFNHPESTVLWEDLNRVSRELLDNVTNGIVSPVGVLGGPPCQSFSLSNVHQRDDDPRHRLPESYAKLLKELNARKLISFFVFENVPGLLSKKHLAKYLRFKDLFLDAGFEIREEFLNAIDFGVPQDRKRIIIVGINQELHPGVEWEPPQPTVAEPVPIDGFLKGLPQPQRNSKGAVPDEFPVHPNHWCMVPRSAKFTDGGLKPGVMMGRSFRQLEWGKPSWTVAYGHREVHVHPEGKRRLSIYEAMLLQTFPTWYRLTGNISAQVRLVSEAVPPLLARQIAKSIKEQLDF